MKHDIYSFINSRDIGEHCRKLGHTFNPAEVAYLIWRSERRTLEERHEAWRELIDATPDMPVPSSEYDSLHEFLDRYIKAENDYIEKFYKEGDNAVYSFWVYNDYGKVNLPTSESIYKTAADCLEHLQWWKEHDNICSLGVSKILLCSRRKFEDTTEIELSPYLKPLRIKDRNVNKDLYKTFCRLCPIVPTPFKKGDIVRIKRKRQCLCLI